MKVIFLDVDGVLNAMAMLNVDYDYENEHMRVSAVAMSRINRLVRESGATVILSASMRVQAPLGHLRSIFRLAGAEFVIADVTPWRTKRDRRGEEIQAWLDAQEVKPEKFVILDDDHDIGQKDRLVQTDCRTGLLDEHVEQALSLLRD